MGVAFSEVTARLQDYYVRMSGGELLAAADVEGTVLFDER